MHVIGLIAIYLLIILINYYYGKPSGSPKKECERVARKLVSL
jgi:hypothetical protein